MDILIVEDEELAVKKLQKTLSAVDDEANVVAITGSISGTVDWLKKNEAPDVILMDIELADGQSFEIFNQVEGKKHRDLYDIVRRICYQGFQGEQHRLPA
jgi:two-component SAPR family response regulator